MSNAKNIAIQSEMPFAIVEGKPYTQMPTDLYIPPEALEVILEAFEGPLDLLLYLIRRQNLNILDIPITEITSQYIEYINLLDEMNFELAAEYLVMAAMLAEIKSRMLLPKLASDEQEEEDPRAELVRRLQEYERFKTAATDIDELPRESRDYMLATAFVENRQQYSAPPEVDMRDLIMAFKDVLARADLKISHEIEREVLSVKDKMTVLLDKLRVEKFFSFESLFNPNEGRQGVVVTFLAVLELLKSQVLDIVQNETYGQIYIKAL
ncbi:Segregation and condensation protein A [hydrothermal vent metagenome]|uniref:Segregation and condensation protein A n=1 Tax=hydrothermal vent metagenome TaxID=652676 RepID=A0A3B0WFG8_9ZZZZ